MMRKRLLCAVLALIWLFSVQYLAAAADTEGSNSLIIEASYDVLDIEVVVPSTGSIIINPYKIPVSIGGIVNNGQIISAPARIANKSEVPLRVDVAVSGEVLAGSDLTLSPKSTMETPGNTNKEVFVYFEMQQTDTEDLSQVQWNETYDAEKHVVIGTEEVTKTGIVTLAAKNPDGSVAEGGYAPFRLTGDAVADPDSGWNSADGIIVAVVFTFTPVVQNDA